MNDDFSDTAPPVQTPQVPMPQEPTAGGRYQRNADGTLTLIHQTQPREGRLPAADAQASGNQE
jgi:hypothetical protein